VCFQSVVDSGRIDDLRHLAMMTLLEKLPIELLHEVASYFAFFDKKALSAVSKKLCARLGPLKCPDGLSWIIHLCCFPSVDGNDWLLARPEFVLEEFDDMRWKFISGRHPADTGMDVDFAHASDEDEELSDKMLLLPYFDKAFPESTLVHFYAHHFHNLALSIHSTLEDAIGNDKASPKSKRIWRCIWRTSRQELDYLERGWPVLPDPD